MIMCQVPEWLTFIEGVTAGVFVALMFHLISITSKALPKHIVMSVNDSDPNEFCIGFENRESGKPVNTQGIALSENIAYMLRNDLDAWLLNKAKARVD